MRLGIFSENLKFVQSHDSEEEGFTVGINKMSDWTKDEYGKLSGKFNKKNKSKKLKARTPTHFTDSDIPESVDWREEGAVSKVRSQEDCGGCYSFTGVGAIEAYYKIANPSWTVEHLSVQ